MTTESYEKVPWIKPNTKVWVVDGNHGHLHGAIILGHPFRLPNVDFLDDRCKKEMIKGIQLSNVSTLMFDSSTFVDGGVWVIYVQWIECRRKDIIECCRLSAPIFVDDSSTIADRMRKKRSRGAAKKDNTPMQMISSKRIKAKPDVRDVKLNHYRHSDSENKLLYSEPEEQDCDPTFSDSDDSFDMTLSRIKARSPSNEVSGSESNDIGPENVSSDLSNNSKQKNQFEKSDIRVKVQIRYNDSFSSKKSYEIISLRSKNENSNSNAKKRIKKTKRTRNISDYNRKRLSIIKLEKRHRLLMNESKQVRGKRSIYKKCNSMKGLISDHTIPINFYHVDFGDSDFSDDE